MGSNPISSIYFCIRSQVVEGGGLIIHFRKDVAGSNPAGCIKVPSLLFYRLIFKRVDFPLNALIKYSFERLTFELCFLVIEAIFGE